MPFVVEVALQLLLLSSSLLAAACSPAVRRCKPRSVTEEEPDRAAPEQGAVRDGDDEGARRRIVEQLLEKLRLARGPSMRPPRGGRHPRAFRPVILNRTTSVVRALCWDPDTGGCLQAPDYRIPFTVCYGPPL